MMTLMMLQPAENEHGGDFTIGRVPTATVFDLQPWVLASLVCPGTLASLGTSVAVILFIL